MSTASKTRGSSGMTTVERSECSRPCPRSNPPGELVAQEQKNEPAETWRQQRAEARRLIRECPHLSDAKIAQGTCLVSFARRDESGRDSHL